MFCSFINGGKEGGGVGGLPLIGQLTPAQVTTSPRLLIISLPSVRRGPYGHWSDVSLVTALRGMVSWCLGSRSRGGTGETGTHDAHPDVANSAQGATRDALITIRLSQSSRCKFSEQ